MTVWILSLIFMVLGMIGGQVQKNVRRLGIPIMSLIAGLWYYISQKKWRYTYKCIVFLLLMPCLMIGYGETSALGKLIKNDYIVRLIYSLILAAVLILAGVLLAAAWWKICIAVAGVVVAWQVRAGKIGSIGSFDFLIEDMCRYFTLGRVILLLIGI